MAEIDGGKFQLERVIKMASQGYSRMDHTEDSHSEGDRSYRTLPLRNGHIPTSIIVEAEEVICGQSMYSGYTGQYDTTLGSCQPQRR